MTDHTLHVAGFADGNPPTPSCRASPTTHRACGHATKAPIAT